MENKVASRFGFLSLSIVAGLVLLGFFIFKGLKTFSDKDRVVTVKGLAEMDMTATSSTISLEFSFSGDELPDLMKQTETKKNAIMDYLTGMGFDQSGIKIHHLGVNDQEKYYETHWVNDQQVKVKIDRYSTFQRLTIPSNEVTKTEDLAAQIMLDLVSKELTCTVSTEYIFPDLNSIKPQLIAESTKNARIAGEQFANDSQAKLGKIKTASQGQITLAGAYFYEEEGSTAPKEAYLQKARVVSTIVFFLE